MRRLLAAVLLAFAAPATAAPTYTLTTLGYLPGGGTESRATGINNSGQITGVSGIRDGRRATLWQNGTATDLGLLSGGFASIGNAINDAGTVAGATVDTSNTPAQIGRATEWIGGTPAQLPGNGGAQSANAINTGGTIAGQTSAGATTWTNGVATVLGSLPGGSQGIASGINDAGQVVGSSRIGSGLSPTRAVLWQNGTSTNLGLLPGAASGSSFAYDINNAGQVVGRATGAGGNLRPYLWAGGVMTDLGDFGSGGGNAWAINDAGRAVGFASGRAAMWFGGAIFDLASLVANLPMGGFLSEARGINERGQIVGYGTFGDGAIQAFLLTPDSFDDAEAVPGPGAFALFALGLAALSRRKARSR